jgi:hypothetical protein
MLLDDIIVEEISHLYYIERGITYNCKYIPIYKISEFQATCRIIRRTLDKKRATTKN